MWSAGAHTLGRVKKDRSGFGKEKTKYTENGPGTPGGTSWTIEWLKFDNSYFKVCTAATGVGLHAPTYISNVAVATCVKSAALPSPSFPGRHCQTRHPCFVYSRCQLRQELGDLFALA